VIRPPFGTVEDDDDPRDFVDLDRLPEDHPMRNTPLGEIGAEYRGVRGPYWLPVEPGRGLGLRTFNTLEDGPWVTFCKWRAPRTPE
jgi:hypothetical protein